MIFCHCNNNSSKQEMLNLSLLSFSVAGARIDVAVNATVGESAVLPCNLQIPTPIALEHLRCYWQDGKKKVLYSLNEGKEMPEHTNEPYRGRITAFPPDMRTGNISVELGSTTIEDDNKVFQAFAAVRDGRSTLGHTLICQITLHVAGKDGDFTWLCFTGTCCANLLNMKLQLVSLAFGYSWKQWKTALCVQIHS